MLFSLSWSLRSSSIDPLLDSLTPTVLAMVARTEPGSRMGARSTKYVPSTKRSLNSAPACSASRVLPVPPGPVSVSRRTVSAISRLLISSSSASRPTKRVGCDGRLLGSRLREAMAGKSAGSSG